MLANVKLILRSCLIFSKTLLTTCLFLSFLSLLFLSLRTCFSYVLHFYFHIFSIHLFIFSPIPIFPFYPFIFHPLLVNFPPPRPIVHHLSPQALKWREYRRKNPLGLERGIDGSHSPSCALESKRPGTRVMRRNVFDFPPTNQPLGFSRFNGAEPISVRERKEGGGICA